MVSEKGRFIAVRFGYLNLSLPTVAVTCRNDSCVLQRVGALVHS